MAMASQSIEIKATPKQCYDVITAYNSYMDFLKDVNSITIESQKGNTARITYEIQVIKPIRYTIDLVGTPHKTVAWTYVKGDIMRDNHGSWELEEVKKGVTKATYNIEVVLPLLVPGSVTKALVGKNLPSMLATFKKRIESLQQK